MTATELINVIGKVGLWNTGRRQGSMYMRARVTVLDARMVFGRQDYLIQPVDGEGSAWVDAGAVVMDS